MKRLGHIPAACGLARNGRGLGIRALQGDLQDVRVAVLGEMEAAKPKLSYYEVANVPRDVHEGGVERALKDWSWEVTVVRSFLRQRGRTWIQCVRK